MIALLSLGFAPVPFPNPKAGMEDLKKMQGKWSRTLWASRPVGDPLTVSVEYEEVEMAIAGNLATFTCLGENRGQYRLVLDATKKPKAIDLRQGDRSVLGVYALNGNTLTICTQMVPCGPRPTNVTAVLDGQCREVFKRKKP
jgi:uncharacterized protein (TIGR03067 family)